MAYSKQRVKVVRKPAPKPVVATAPPEKIVIVAGPSFGNAMKFVLFGASLGAAATYYFLSNRSSSASSGPDAVTEGLTAGGTKDNPEQVAARLNSLAQRAKKLAARTKTTMQTAAKVLGPSVAQAVVEGRKAAREAQNGLAEDLKNPPSPEKPKDEPEIAAEQA